MLEQKHIFILLLLPFLLFGCQSITGKVTDSFSVQAIVSEILFDLSSYEQETIAYTQGNDVSINIPMTYFGSGEKTVVVNKPASFSNGFAWYVREDGVHKNVSVASDSLSWDANLSAQNMALHFIVPPPKRTVISTQKTGLLFEQTVVVSAPNSFRNVSTQTIIDASYEDFVLLEGGVDVSEKYSFFVSEAVAYWEGFHLSDRTFIVRASKQALGGGRSVCVSCVYCWDGSFSLEKNCPPAPQDNSSPTHTIIPEEVDVSFLEGEEFSFEITIINGFDKPREYTFVSEQLFVGVRSISLAEGERVIKSFTVPNVVGEWQDTITISSEDVYVQIPIYVNVILREEEVILAPVLESPGVTQESNQAIAIIFIFLAALLLFASAYWFFRK